MAVADIGDVRKRWLRDLWPGRYEDDVISRALEAMPGTCDWIFDDPTFQSWLNGGSQGPRTVWIFGGPGSGKSILSGFLAARLGDRPDTGLTVCFHAFDFARRHSRGSDEEDTLRDLLFQLLKANPFLIDLAIQASNSRLCDPRWDVESLEKTLSAVIRHPSCQAVIFILDGLDECMKSDMNRLAKFLLSLVSASGGLLRLMVFSRWLPALAALASQGATISLDDRSNQDDISRFIRIRLQKICNRRKLRPAIASDLERMINSQAKGSFLQASMILQELERARTFENMKQIALQTEGPPLDVLYKRLIEMGGNVSQSVRTLQTIIASCRELTVVELGLASGIVQPDQDGKLTEENVSARVIELCQRLVVFTEGKVRLIHISVRDFILGYRDETVGSRPKSIPEMHEMLAQRCMEYLCQLKPSENLSATKVEPDVEEENTKRGDTCITEARQFLNYAATYWAEHLQLSGNAKEYVGDVTRLCDSQSTPFSIWFPVYWCTLKPPRERPLACTGLLVASHFGFTEAMVHFLSKGSSVREQDEQGQSAIHYAAWSGHTAAVKMLVDKHRQFESHGSGGQCYDYEEALNKPDKKSRTALHLASGEGHFDTVEALVEAHAYVDVRDAKQETALHYAVRGEHRQVVACLLDHDVDVDAVDGREQTPLHMAAALGNGAIVKLLLGKDPDLMAKDADNHTAKLCAQRKRDSMANGSESDKAKAEALSTVIEMLHAAEFFVSKLTRKLSHDTAKVEKGFEATVAWFPPGIPKGTRRVNMDELLDKEKAKTGDWFRARNDEPEAEQFWWFHLPANNVCVPCSSDSKKGELTWSPNY